MYQSNNDVDVIESPSVKLSTEIWDLYYCGNRLRNQKFIIKSDNLLRGGSYSSEFCLFYQKLGENWAFPKATPTSTIWKNLPVIQKDQRRRSVWVGQAHFSKLAQRKQKIIKLCVFI